MRRIGNPAFWGQGLRSGRRRDPGSFRAQPPSWVHYSAAPAQCASTWAEAPHHLWVLLPPVPPPPAPPPLQLAPQLCDAVRGAPCATVPLRRGATTPPARRGGGPSLAAQSKLQSAPSRPRSRGSPSSAAAPAPPSPVSAPVPAASPQGRGITDAEPAAPTLLPPKLLTAKAVPTKCGGLNVDLRRLKPPSASCPGLVVALPGMHGYVAIPTAALREQGILSSEYQWAQKSFRVYLPGHVAQKRRAGGDDPWRGMHLPAAAGPSEQLRALRSNRRDPMAGTIAADCPLPLQPVGQPGSSATELHVRAQLSSGKEVLAVFARAVRSSVYLRIELARPPPEGVAALIVRMPPGSGHYVIPAAALRAAGALRGEAWGVDELRLGAPDESGDVSGPWAEHHVPEAGGAKALEAALAQPTPPTALAQPTPPDFSGLRPSAAAQALRRWRRKAGVQSLRPRSAATLEGVLPLRPADGARGCAWLSLGAEEVLCACASAAPRTGQSIMQAGLHNIDAPAELAALLVALPSSPTGFFAISAAALRMHGFLEEGRWRRRYLFLNPTATAGCAAQWSPFYVQGSNRAEMLAAVAAALRGTPPRAWSPPPAAERPPAAAPPAAALPAAAEPLTAAGLPASAPPPLELELPPARQRRGTSTRTVQWLDLPQRSGAGATIVSIEGQEYSVVCRRAREKNGGATVDLPRHPPPLHLRAFLVRMQKPPGVLALPVEVLRERRLLTTSAGASRWAKCLVHVHGPAWEPYLIEDGPHSAAQIAAVIAAAEAHSPPGVVEDRAVPPKGRASGLEELRVGEDTVLCARVAASPRPQGRGMRVDLRSVPCPAALGALLVHLPGGEGLFAIPREALLLRAVLGDGGWRVKSLSVWSPSRPSCYRHDPWAGHHVPEGGSLAAGLAGAPAPAAPARRGGGKPPARSAAAAVPLPLVAADNGLVWAHAGERRLLAVCGALDRRRGAAVRLRRLAAPAELQALLVPTEEGCLCIPAAALTRSGALDPNGGGWKVPILHLGCLDSGPWARFAVPRADHTRGGPRLAAALLGELPPSWTGKYRVTRKAKAEELQKWLERTLACRPHLRDHLAIVEARAELRIERPPAPAVRLSIVPRRAHVAPLRWQVTRVPPLGGKELLWVELPAGRFMLLPPHALERRLRSGSRTLVLPRPGARHAPTLSAAALTEYLFDRELDHDSLLRKIIAIAKGAADTPYSGVRAAPRRSARARAPPAATSAPATAAPGLPMLVPPPAAGPPTLVPPPAAGPPTLVPPPSAGLPTLVPPPAPGPPTLVPPPAPPPESGV